MGESVHRRFGLGRGWSSFARAAAALMLAASGSGVACYTNPGAPVNRVLGQLRGLVAAQAFYQTINCGYYDSIECLMAPPQCLPGLTDEQAVALSGPGLDYRWQFEERHGYTFRFYPGPSAEPTDAWREGYPADGYSDRLFGPDGPPDACSPTSLQGWAVTAVPTQKIETDPLVALLLPRSLRRRELTMGFCADHSGRICYTKDGSEIPVNEYGCDVRCEDLQSRGRARRDSRRVLVVTDVAGGFYRFDDQGVSSSVTPGSTTGGATSTTRKD